MSALEHSMKRTIVLLGSLILLGAAALAADVTGTWKGQFDFSGTAVPLTFDLKASGETLTGTITGLPSGVAEIHDGKIQGAVVTFSALTEYQGSPIKLVYRGEIAGNEIKLTMGTDDGSWGVDFVIKRGS
jgi:opacity protein-like surface antigen